MEKKSVKKKVSQRCLQHQIYEKSSEKMAKYYFTITITVNLHNLSLLHPLAKNVCHYIKLMKHSVYSVSPNFHINGFKVLL